MLNQQVMKEHENIFTAILHEKPDLAKKAMWEHHLHIKERHMQSRLTRMGEEK